MAASSANAEVLLLKVAGLAGAAWQKRAQETATREEVSPARAAAAARSASCPADQTDIEGSEQYQTSRAPTGGSDSESSSGAGRKRSPTNSAERRRRRSPRSTAGPAPRSRPSRAEVAINSLVKVSIINSRINHSSLTSKDCSRNNELRFWVFGVLSGSPSWPWGGPRSSPTRLTEVNEPNQAHEAFGLYCSPSPLPPSIHRPPFKVEGLGRGV